MRRVFAFDAETDGLWGGIRAIGAVVCDDNGAIVRQFFARTADNTFHNRWVRQNVLPGLPKQNIMSYRQMLEAFLTFYTEVKAEAEDGGHFLEMVVHMGYIVEARLLREMRKVGMGEGAGPYPLHDVATALRLHGYDPTSVDEYLKHRPVALQPKGHTCAHNPVYDSYAAARTWLDLACK